MGICGRLFCVGAWSCSARCAALRSASVTTSLIVKRNLSSDSKNSVAPSHFGEAWVLEPERVERDTQNRQSNIHRDKLGNTPPATGCCSREVYLIVSASRMCRCLCKHCCLWFLPSLCMNASFDTRTHQSLHDMNMLRLLRESNVMPCHASNSISASRQSGNPSRVWSRGCLLVGHR